MDPIGSDVDVASVVGEDCAVDYQLVQNRWVDVQKDGPVAVDLYPVAGLRQHSVGPLTGVAPPSDEILLDKSARRSGAVVPTYHPVDFRVLEGRSVFTALAYGEHSAGTFLVVVEILPVFADGGVEVAGVFGEVVGGGEFTGAAAHGSDLK